MSKKVFIWDVNNWERIFNAKYSLTRHISSKHYKKKRFECKNWGKKFSLSHNLKEHEFVHTQALPFVCGIDGCMQSFRQRGKLWLHRTKQHTTYIKRKYKKYNEANREEEIIDFRSSMPSIAMPLGMNSVNPFNTFNKFIKLDNYQGMMTMDFHQPTDFQQPMNYMRYMNSGMQRPERMFTFENRPIAQPTMEQSENSDEESKEFKNRREDELFLHPYSSMFRRKDA